MALYEAGGRVKPDYVRNAVLAAKFLLVNQTILPSGGWTEGPVLYDGAGCEGSTCAQFKGIAFRCAPADCPSDPAPRPCVRAYDVCVRARYLVQLCSLPAAVLEAAEEAAGFTSLNCSTVLASNANSLWERARGEQRTLFGVNWAGPPPATPSTVCLGAQSSAAMALALYAKWVPA